jgi:hypothetical protein
MKGYIGIMRSDGTYSVKEYDGDYDRIVNYHSALIFGHVDNKNSPVIVTDSKEHLVSIFESMGIYEES